MTTSNPLNQDLLTGAKAIAEFLGWPQRKVYHANARRLALACPHIRSRWLRFQLACGLLRRSVRLSSRGVWLCPEMGRPVQR
jgi:hypothetical protein